MYEIYTTVNALKSKTEKPKQTYKGYLQYRLLFAVNPFYNGTHYNSENLYNVFGFARNEVIVQNVFSYNSKFSLK